MKTLLFLFSFTLLGSFHSFGQGSENPGFDLVLVKRAKAEKKAKKHSADYVREKEWGNNKIELTQWEKGNYEIWFYTETRVVGKMHYNSQGNFIKFEERDWSIKGY